MNVFVTGGTGFIGSHLVSQLLNRGHNVRCLARDEIKADALRQKGAEAVIGNIINKETYSSALSGVDIVFHLAAALDANHLPDEAYWETNVGGTRFMLEASEAAGVKRFVHCSSVGVYAHSSQAIKEDAPYYPNPTNAYHQTKQEAEKLVKRFMKQTGMPITIVRPAAIVYGEGDFSNVLGLFRTINKGQYVVIGSGKSYLHQIYIEDLARGICLAGESERAAGESYILADKNPATIGELSNAIGEALGVKLIPVRLPEGLARLLAIPIEILAKVSGFAPPLSQSRINTLTENRLYATDKAKEQLGFESETSLGEGMKHTAAWYKANGHL